MKWILPGLLVLTACATTPAQREAREQRRMEEHARLQRCSRIEMYPMGVTPPRPYRVLGPVSATNDNNPASRNRALQDQACAIGADAVIDINETRPFEDATAGPSGTARESSTIAGGTAVAFTDGEAAPPPP